MSQSLRECLLLLPCSGLDDFPETLASADSQQLLNGWLALWHPNLVALTHCAPRWQAADQPPHNFSGVLAVAANCCRSHLPSDMAATAQRGGGWLVDADRDWGQLQGDWLRQVTIDGSLPEATASYWQREFAALGYAYLQIQLLTRQLRYTSNLDQVVFDSQLDQAASAALVGDSEEAERMLQSCFDQLGQERDHYYSLDVSLLDVTLLAVSTLGSAVIGQLGRPHPSTFVASADLLRQMHASQPAVAQALREALSQRRASLAGGLDIERPHALMSFDALKRDLERGRQAYQELGFQRPTVFTRFSYGQTSDMPLHLRRSGFVASMLIAWQQGTYPSGSHAKFSWEASEGTFLNTVAPPLVDAQDATTYLTLGRRVAEALDHQHVPVFMLAHWPNNYSPFFELLERVIARTPALGRWQHIDDFFEKTDQPYHQEHLPPRKFVFDWLTWQPASPKPTLEPDQLLTATSAHRSLANEVRSLQNLANLCYQLENFRSTTQTDATATNPLATDVTSTNITAETMSTALGATADVHAGTNSNGGVVVSNASLASAVDDTEAQLPRALSLLELDAPLATLAEQVDGLFDSADHAAMSCSRVQAAIDELRQVIGARFARAAGHSTVLRDASFNNDPVHDQLVVNPSSAPQRFTLVSHSEVAPAAAGSWLYATGRSGDQRLSMVDVPGYGMLRVPFQRTTESKKRREPTLVQGDGLLINDFLEAQIDPRTGSLRGLHIPGKRGNRLSVQLARREKSGAAAATYSQLQATDVRTLESSSVRGMVRASGKIFHGGTGGSGGQTSGAFEIDYTLTRGQRILAITVRLNHLVALNDSPWKSAYVLRTAWPNESAVITCRACGSRHPWSAGKAVAPTLIEIDDVDHRTYLLTGGLAFHQRVEERFLETILSTGSPTEGEYRFGVAVDLPNPLIAANYFGQPPLVVPLTSKNNAPLPGSSDSTAAWLMHVDAKQVVMELDAPLVDATGACAGIRVHLTEFANKSVTAKIRGLREVSEAHRVDYLGGRIAKLTVEGDTTSIALRPGEMTFVDVLWR